jgi:HSP20 family protein
MSNISRWDPFAELSALQKQFFGDDWFAPTRSITIPTTDVYTQNDKELVVEAHLPNFDEKDVNVNIEHGALTIQAENHEQEKDKDKKYIVRESSNSFYRRIQLPDRAMQDDVQAHMENGILKVTVPLRELPSPKRIAINAKSK